MPEITHLFMTVTDLDRARSFYIDVLGLDLVMETPTYLRVGTNGGFQIGIQQREPEKVGAVGVKLNIRVDDVMDAYRRMTALGVDFDNPPQRQKWGDTQAWFRDPFGYRMSIYSTP